jgi:Recombination endonuclease VII
VKKPKSRKARDRQWHLLRSAKRVGLPRDVFKAMLTEAPKRCEICRAKSEVNDHCHKRNRHRGRLCHPCNTAIGLMKDSPARLRSAADYLESFVEYLEDNQDE